MALQKDKIKRVISMHYMNEVKTVSMRDMTVRYIIKSMLDLDPAAFDVRLGGKASPMQA